MADRLKDNCEQQHHTPSRSGELKQSRGFHSARRAIRRWVRGKAAARGVRYLGEELLSTADLALVLALRAWRPDRGPFQAFAWQYVKRETLRLIQAEGRQRATRAELQREPQQTPIADTMVDRELYLTMLETLGTGEAVDLALGHLVQGRTFRELAANGGCSIRQVRNHVQSVVAIVKEVGMIGSIPG